MPWEVFSTLFGTGNGGAAQDQQGQAGEQAQTNPHQQGAGQQINNRAHGMLAELGQIYTGGTAAGQAYTTAYNNQITFGYQTAQLRNTDIVDIIHEFSNNMLRAGVTCSEMVVSDNTFQRLVAHYGVMQTYVATMTTPDGPIPPREEPTELNIATSHGYIRFIPESKQFERKFNLDAYMETV